MTATVRAALSIAEALFSREGALPPRDRLEFLGAELSDFLARSGRRSRFFLSLLVWVVTIVAPLFVFRVGPLAGLGLGLRVRALSSLEERLPAPLLAVKGLLCLLYYEHPDAARDVGFDGACLVPSSHVAGAAPP